jgi:gamma-glutamylcyclotransferase (GGCT)/AIG2-like uncharacterized protein YtfP
MPMNSPTRPICTFFVYGTLMRGESNHAVAARHGLADVRTGSVSGDLFDTGAGYPAMRPTTGPGRVYGELLIPIDFESALQSMDALEGYEGEDDPENLYDRRLIEVTFDDDGSTCLAWVYVYAQDLAPHMRIASGRWRRTSGD